MHFSQFFQGAYLDQLERLVLTGVMMPERAKHKAKTCGWMNAQHSLTRNFTC
jgi:hypothetical protein